MRLSGSKYKHASRNPQGEGSHSSRLSTTNSVPGLGGRERRRDIMRRVGPVMLEFSFQPHKNPNTVEALIVQRKNRIYLYFSTLYFYSHDVKRLFAGTLSPTRFLCGQDGAVTETSTG